MLAGVIAIDRDVDTAQVLDGMIAAIPRRSSRAITTIFAEPSLRCSWFADASPHAEIWDLEARDGRKIFVCGHVALPAADIPHVQDQLKEAPEKVLLELPGMWNALVLDPRTKRVRLAADRLGVAWLFLARRAGALVFGHHFGAVAQAAGGAHGLNVPATLATLEMGYTPAPQTCLQGVEVLPGGRILEVQPGRNETVASRNVTYGDTCARLTLAEKYAALDSAYQTAFEAWCGRWRDDVLSLSAGYDSACALGVALCCGYRPRCVTFGFSRNLELRGAQRTAADAGVAHDVFQMPAPRWDEYVRTVARAGVIGGQAYVHGWAERWLNWASIRGRGMIIGYLGDALTGKHVIGEGSGIEDWRRRWEEWSYDGGWDELSVVRPDVRGAFKLTSGHQFDEILAGVTTAFPHQIQLHMDLYGRQARVIAVQPNLVSDYLRPALMFYHPSVLDVWCSAGLTDLRDQRLYLAHAKSRFSRVFKEKFEPALIPGMRRVLERVMGRIVPPLGRWMQRPIDDRLTVMLAFRQRIRCLAQRFSVDLGEIFDVRALLDEIDAFPRPGGLRPVQLSRLCGVLVMLQAARGKQEEEFVLPVLRG